MERRDHAARRGTFGLFSFLHWGSRFEEAACGFYSAPPRCFSKVIFLGTISNAVGSMVATPAAVWQSDAFRNEPNGRREWAKAVGGLFRRSEQLRSRLSRQSAERLAAEDSLRVRVVRPGWTAVSWRQGARERADASGEDAAELARVAEQVVEVTRTGVGGGHALRAQHRNPLLVGRSPAGAAVS